MSNYKMAVTVDYQERDSDPAAVQCYPSLAEVLQATSADGFTWNSNPYIEHGRGNARTNCIDATNMGAARPVTI